MNKRTRQCSLVLASCLLPIPALAAQQGLLGTLIIGGVGGALMMIVALLYYWVWTPYSQRATDRKRARRAAELPKILVLAAEGDLDGVRSCLDNGIDPNVSGKMGETPLMLAARNGRLEVIELLLVRGADPTKLSRTGSTAQDVARTYGHGHVEHFLNEFPTKPSSSAVHDGA